MKINKSTLIPLVALMLVSSSCSGTKKNGIYNNENNVGYQLLVYSFNDSDGDGRGDIKGITEKLDYFVELGVNTLWLSPINKAGSYHGYDVQDYYSVDSKLGTEDDLKELIEEAHKKDIKILLDMVVNHSSSSHPWFIEACRDSDSKYREYYIFKDDSITYGTSSNTSAGWHNRSNNTYYSSFTSSMPDLNLSSKAVRKEIENIFKYWIDFGVDGFRLDAIKHFFDGQEYSSDTNVKTLTQEYFAELNKAMKKVNPNIFFVGEWLDESYTSYLTSAPYIDSQFSFSSRKLLVDNLASGKSALGYASKFVAEINACKELNDDFIYTPIIGNHDHDRIAYTYGFYENKFRLRQITAVQLTLPGMPFIYSGDEFALQGGRYADDDIERRLPFLWGGGNEVNPDTYGKGKYKTSLLDNRVSYKDAKNDTLSLFNLYKDILKVRKSLEAYKGGNMSVVGNDDNSNIMAYFISNSKQKIIVLHNIKNSTESISLSIVNLGDLLFSTYALNEFNNDFEKDNNGNYTYSKDGVYEINGELLTLKPYSTVIFEVK